MGLGCTGLSGTVSGTAGFGFVGVSVGAATDKKEKLEKGSQLTNCFLATTAWTIPTPNIKNTTATFTDHYCQQVFS
jgi:hypothetical protein